MATVAKPKVKPKVKEKPVRKPGFPSATVKKDVLSKGLSVISKAISPNPISPLLSNVLLESANGSSQLTATNYELGITYIMETKGEAFKACVPAAMFKSLVDTLSAVEIEIQMNAVEQSAVIMTDISTSSLRCAPPDEFPPLPKVTSPNITLPVQQFKQMVNRVAFASDAGGDNTILSGVLLVTEAVGKKSKFIMVATNGLHLSFEETNQVTKKKEGEIYCVVKGTTLETISKVLPEEGDLELEASTNKLLFHCGGVHVVCQLLNGKFPDYNLLASSIGEATTTLKISTVELLRACRQLKVFGAEGGKSKMEVQGMMVRYSTSTQERGDSDITLGAVVTGFPITIGISVLFLMDFLEICDTEMVIIEFSATNKPIKFGMKGLEGFFHIIMPIGL